MSTLMKATETMLSVMLDDLLRLASESKNREEESAVLALVLDGLRTAASFVGGASRHSAKSIVLWTRGMKILHE